MGSLSKRLFGISPDETRFATRRFRCDTPDVRERLEEVGRCFVRGYHAALEEDRPIPLAERLEEITPEFRGFAYEGAGMALAILDSLTPWRRGRVEAFLRGPAEPHIYLVLVGAGWALARLPLSVDRMLARFDMVKKWLVLDGYGFHQGYFHWPRAIAGQERPRRLAGYARRTFDQGIGRSLWFVEGAGIDRIAERIAAFPAERRGDIWSGVGLACTYAGGVSAADIEDLRQAAGEHAPQLGQGAAFAAKARARAGNLVSHTELACRVLCGTGAEEAAAVTDRAAVGLPPDQPANGLPAVPAFEVWRQRIQQSFVPGGIAV
jgi:enediyne biosynthesis protein E3